MAYVTTHFGIPGPVPFVDVDVDEDNRLFLDPRAVRMRSGQDPFAGEAVRSLDTFLGTITSAALSTNPRQRTHGLHLLQTFPEPWETRLGMSARGFYGHGGAEEAGTRIWTALTTDLRVLVQVGMLHQLEHLPLFIEGIDRDITSDITTRVIFHPLLRFTAAMVARYPQLAQESTVVTDHQVWDTHQRRWTIAREPVPTANGKPVVLVPKGWARRTLLMNATRFHSTSLLSYAQMEQAAFLPNGEILTTPKDALKKQEGLTPGRGTNIAVTLRAYEEGDDLVRLFSRFVDSRFDVTTKDAA